MPKTDYHLFQGGDELNVLVTLGVSGKRPDGVEVIWWLTLQTESEDLVIVGGVTIGNDEEVFTLTERTSDHVRATQHIASIAERVCAHREGTQL